MRKTLLFALITLALTACATYDAPPPEPEREWGGGRPRGDFGAARRVAATELGLPSAWWRDPVLAEPLALTADQFQRLDALSDEQDEVERLESDAMTAMRDLRASIEAKNATAADILAAGKRLRELRDTLLDRQIALLASQREILTQEQWADLQETLANEWRGRRNERGEEMRDAPRRGGRGGRGGGFGGRRPGGVW